MSFALLDYFSTSQKTGEKCKNRTPVICVPPNGQDGRLYQTCCNDWTCPRCGKLRAKYEYGKIVEGVKTLNREHDLYFMTLTCKGDAELEDAEKNYLKWTNGFLSTLRAHVKKNAGYWCYAGVTERQQRQHPHSHYLTTFAPKDAFNIKANYEKYVSEVKAINEQIDYAERFSPTPYAKVKDYELHSTYLMLSARKAGLGVQASIGRVKTPEGASRYTAKYLFKEAVYTKWPKGWKRIRYSQSWPKFKPRKSGNGFPVFGFQDWADVGSYKGFMITHSLAVYEKALLYQCRNVLYEMDRTIKEH